MGDGVEVGDVIDAIVDSIENAADRFGLTDVEILARVVAEVEARQL